MMEFKQRLAKLNVVWRKNVSVPNPAESDTGIVEQVYINIGVILKIKVHGELHQAVEMVTDLDVGRHHQILMKL